MLVHIIGFFAAFTSTISLVPQIIKMFKTRSVGDISTGMLVNFLLTSLFWIAYGVMTDCWSVWVTNIIGLWFSLIMVWLKVKYNKVVVR